MGNLPDKKPIISDDEWRDNDKTFIRLGWLVVLAGILGFFIWAAVAPLDKGVSSQGTVTVSGNRKEIQAPVTGIISQILVKDGETVKTGQTLVVLSQIEAKAQRLTLQNQYLTALATIDRLKAELHQQEKVVWSAVLAEDANRELATSVMALQVALFNSRRLTLNSNLEADKQSQEGYRLQLAGLKASQESKSRQIASLREQMRNFDTLSEAGYLPRNRYLEIQQQYADANGSLAEINGRVGQLSRQIQEMTQRIIQRNAEFMRDVQTELNQMRLDAEDFKNRLDMATFELAKTEIVAPVDGVIVDQSVFTQGGTVSTGERLFDIVPQASALVINAQLRVDLIDKVYEGLPVELLFTAFNANKTPRIPGVVTLVSADRLTDADKAEPYYKVQVTVTPEGMKLLSRQEMKPGMSVVVFVKTGSRSLLNYLFKPIVDRMHVSLTEE
ncbi:MAG: HlyD family type I secretion periplasmic adaptor subunit [Hafnia sp.]